jgi:hypothetical protein
MNARHGSLTLQKSRVLCVEHPQNDEGDRELGAKPRHQGDLYQKDKTESITDDMNGDSDRKRIRPIRPLTSRDIGGQAGRKSRNHLSKPN